MKIRLRGKILTLFLLISVLPLSFITIFFLYNVKSICTKIIDDSKAMGETAIIDSTQALNELGEAAIENKAIDVAKQLEIYIKSKPMTVVDYQADELFKSIAVQKVGSTGYTAVTDYSTLIARFHSNSKIVNTDLHNLAEKLPDFWRVMSQSYGGKEFGGYYNWAEADGSITRKYMYIVPLKVATTDGVYFNVAATTYIHDFSAPTDAIKEKVNSAVSLEASREEGGLNSAVKTYAYYLIILLVAVISIIIGIFFADNLSEPLVNLTQVATQVSKGNFGIQIEENHRSDEIAELSASVEMLVAAAKMKK